jgi:hypothetical protein
MSRNLLEDVAADRQPQSAGAEHGTLSPWRGGPAAGELSPGTPVRIIRDPWFGRLGTVAALPHEPRVLESGSKARVLEVRLDSGDSVTVPRANVELIES